MYVTDLRVDDGPVTLRAGGREPFDFVVVDGCADIDTSHVSAVLAAFGGTADPTPVPTNEEPSA